MSHSGAVPPIGEDRRARRDFAHWRAGVLVLAPQPHDGPLRRTVTELVGRPGTWTGGVWVGDLHEGT